jgi:hypothetical protein
MPSLNTGFIACPLQLLERFRSYANILPTKEQGLQVVHDIRPYVADATAQNQYNLDVRFDANGLLALRAHTILGLP